MITTDDRLRDLAPDDLSRVAPDWRQRRGQILTAVLADTGTDAAPAPIRARLWRRVAVGVAAALALTAGAVTTSGLLTPTTAQAAALNRVAAEVKSAEWTDLKPGQYVHVTTTGHQVNRPGVMDGPLETTTVREQWIGADGTSYEWRDPRDNFSGEAHIIFTTSGGQQGSPNYPTPEFIAAMPSTGKDLRAWLDPRVSGSQSHEEAIFVAGSDLLGSQLVPPAKRAAIFEMMGQLNDVRVDEHVTVGEYRDVTRIVWTQRKPQESYLLVDASGSVVQVGQTSPDVFTFTSDSRREIVSSLPAPLGTPQK